MTLKALTVFSGVECFGLAAERAGIDVVASCEKDPAARGVIRYHYPDHTIYNDITEMTADALAADGHIRPDGRGGWTGIDLIIGGWPCQDLSVAGNRAGLAGSRSGLWWELLRIVDAVRPRWVIGENVPGLLSSNAGRDMGIVIGSLGDLGYGLAWRVLDAQFFGVPNAVVASSLSEILETGPHLRRYCLSPKAAAGILRRAAKRGRKLPPALLAALTSLAS